MGRVCRHKSDRCLCVTCPVMCGDACAKCAHGETHEVDWCRDDPRREFVNNPLLDRVTRRVTRSVSKSPMHQIVQVEKALGFKLHPWQVDFILGRSNYYDPSRRSGKTLAHLLRLFLNDDYPLHFYIGSLDWQECVDEKHNAHMYNVNYHKRGKELYNILLENGVEGLREVYFTKQGAYEKTVGGETIRVQKDPLYKPQHSDAEMVKMIANVVACILEERGAK